MRRWPLYAAIGIALSAATVHAGLKPGHRGVLNDMQAVERAIGDIEAQAQVVMQQCQRARTGLRAMRSGDTGQELEALVNTVKALGSAVAVATRALGLVDDGKLEPGMTARPNGDLDR